MAVLRQELTRTTFQDRQIKLMTDLYTEVRTLDKDLNTGFSSLKNSIVSGVDRSIQGLYYSFVKYFETGTAAFISDISDLMDDLREGIDEDSSSRETSTSRAEYQVQAERYQQYLSTQRDTLDKVKTIVNTISSIGRIFGISLDRYLDIANTVSDLRNIAVRNTGLSRDEIIAFQTNISDTVNTLNERTGNMYSKVNSFELLVGLINQTGIKNLEFYEEYGELFITTQKTMNVNLGTLAEFASDFYRVYKFSSSGMENLMESIKKNTAGTFTDEQKLTSFLSNISSDIRYFEYRTGGREGLEDRVVASQDRVGGVYTWLRELGFDADDLFNKVISAGRGGPAGSQDYIDLVKSTNGAIGNQKTLMSRFLTDPAGLMIDILRAQGAKSSLSGLNSYALSNVYGYNFQNATQAEMFMNQLTRENYKTFMANRSEGSTEEDQFMSAEDRAANATEDIGIQMSDLQESLGIKLETIQEILNKILAAVIAIKGVSLLGSLLGGGGGSGSGWLSRLFSGGGSAAAGAAAGGGFFSRIGDLLSSPIGKLGAVGLGVGLVVNDSLNNHGNDDLIDSEGNLTELGIANGLTQEDALLYQLQQQELEDRDSIFSKNVIGGILNTSDANELQRYYDFLRTSPSESDIRSRREMIMGHFTVRHDGKNKGTMDSWLNSVEEAARNPLSEDLPPEFFYGVGKDTSVYDQKLFYEDFPNWSSTPFSDSKWDGNPEASYASGTTYVPNDQLALIHEGEAVIPAEDNPFSKYSTIDRTSYLKEISATSKNIEAGNYSLKSVIEYLSKILTFMQYWKSNSDENDIVSSVLESARNMNIKLQLVSGDTGLDEDDALGYSSDGGVG